MKLIKILALTMLFSSFSLFSTAEEKKDCSQIKNDTIVKSYDKIRCMMGKEKGEGIGKKLKSFFKKEKI